MSSTNPHDNGHSASTPRRLPEQREGMGNKESHTDNRTIPYHRGRPCSQGEAADRSALKLAQAIHEDTKPLATILFGSRARGNHKEPTSDVDILIIKESLTSTTHEHETKAKIQALNLYGRDIKVQMVWVNLEQFDQERPYINSLSTQAMLDGFIFSGHPQHFTTPYASNTPPSPKYNWSEYEYWLKSSREHLVIIKALLHPKQALELPAAASDNYYMEEIPHMTKDQRWTAISRRANIPINLALKAAVTATGGFSKILASTTDNYKVLRKALPYEDLSTSIPIQTYQDHGLPQNVPISKAAQMLIGDITKIRKLAMHTRRLTNRNAAK